MHVLRQTGFDTLGPAVHARPVATGRTVRYIDEGRPAWTPLAWFGGAGTTVRAFRLLEFARSLREELQIRVLSVERNGLGETPFDPAAGYEEYAADVWALLDELEVSDASLMAISGGGPYAAHVAAAAPGRVRSLHLACTYSERRVHTGVMPPVDEIASDPVTWWRYPDDSPLQRIPGFVDAAAEEATVSVFTHGRDAPAEGLRQAFALYAQEPLPDLSRVAAPAFLYWGSADDVVPAEHMQRWAGALENVVATRMYEGEGHDIQYRHWDQILADIAFLGGRTVLAHDGKTLLVEESQLDAWLDRGATLGLAAWAATPQPRRSV
jgi:non-heme chloroperoxidase